MDLITAAADLLLGAACPGCGRPSTSLCASCRARIVPVPGVVAVPAAVPVVAAGEHDGVLRLAIVAWKEENRWSLLRPLAHLLAASVADALGDSSDPAVLVPVPTSRRSRRARGADVVDALARGAADLLRSTGVDVSVRQALVLARRTADQAGLGVRERARNLDGAFALHSDDGLEGRAIVVVDDIVTTGATLREAIRVLTVAGHRPIAAATAAHRPRG
jgi:ComF family protein